MAVHLEKCQVTFYKEIQKKKNLCQWALNEKVFDVRYNENDSVLGAPDLIWKGGDRYFYKFTEFEN